MLIYVIGGLAFLTIAGLGIALTGDKSDAARKRAKAIGTGGSGASKRDKAMDENAKRRQKTQEMLDTMRKQDKERRKSIRPQNLSSRLTQAGLDVPVSAFWIFSLVLGMALGGTVYILGFDGLVISGISFKSRPALVGGAFFFGAVGLPRILLGMATNGRNKKMINQFADALDIIVRGVKSGLPLNECVRIISKESPEPLRSEFAMLTDNLSMGAGLERSLNTFYKRVPLQEVNFFMIAYIMQLFTTDTGHLFLTIGVVMMSMGILVMRKMINFDL